MSVHKLELKLGGWEHKYREEKLCQMLSPRSNLRRNTICFRLPTIFDL